MKSTGPRDAPAPSGAGCVRVVGGQWKRSKLPVLDAAGLRPTPERVRETLFDWLGNDLSGWRCLDAFAGSGALGFEAASRGAASVLLLELEPRLVANLQCVKSRLGASQVQVRRSEALAWMSQHEGDAFDLIFLDPPYHAGLVPASLGAALRLLAHGGLVYLESRAPLDGGQMAAHGLRVQRALRAGQVHAGLLERAGDTRGAA